MDILCTLAQITLIINGPVALHTGQLAGVLESTAEAEIVNHFDTGEATLYAKRILDDLGHPQPATIIFTDNVCSKEHSNDTIKGTKLRHFDRRYEWLKHIIANSNN